MAQYLLFSQCHKLRINGDTITLLRQRFFREWCKRQDRACLRSRQTLVMQQFLLKLFKRWEDLRGKLSFKTPSRIVENAGKLREKE